MSTFKDIDTRLGDLVTWSGQITQRVNRWRDRLIGLEAKVNQLTERQSADIRRLEYRISALEQRLMDI